MRGDQEKFINCACGEPYMSLEIFKEAGTWLIICHNCDRMEYSSTTKKRLIDKWQKSVEKSKNSIDEYDTLKGEIFEGIRRWTHNISVRWRDEYGNNIPNDEVEDLIALFANCLDDINNKL